MEALTACDLMWANRVPDVGLDGEGAGEQSPAEDSGDAPGLSRIRLADPGSLARLQQYSGRSNRRPRMVDIDTSDTSCHPGHEESRPTASPDLRGATSAEVEAAREARVISDRAQEAARATQARATRSLDEIRIRELEARKIRNATEEKLRQREQLQEDMARLESLDESAERFLTTISAELRSLQEELFRQEDLC